MIKHPHKTSSLRIQLCPKKGISPTILLWGWDLDHQSYSREGSGFLGLISYKQLNSKMPVTKTNFFNRATTCGLFTLLERTWMCILSSDAHLSHVQSQVAWWTFWYNFSTRLNGGLAGYGWFEQKIGCSEEYVGVFFFGTLPETNIAHENLHLS